MPYYKISMVLKSDANHLQERRIVVFRQYEEPDIEKVWQRVENKCRSKWGGKLKDFNCVLFSKRSPDYQLICSN